MGVRVGGIPDVGEDVFVRATTTVAFVEVDRVVTGVRRMGVEFMEVGNDNAVGVSNGSSVPNGDSLEIGSIVVVTMAGSVPINEYRNAVAVGTS